jgi:hypothetical protein
MEDARRESVRLEALSARQEAQQLLAQLTAELQVSQAGNGGRDLYKQVTGHSSLERAVDETRRMIDCYDRVLAQLDKAEGDVVVGRLNWQRVAV